MKQRKPYEPPKIIDLQVDYTQAVGASACDQGGQATGLCRNGGQANDRCNNGNGAEALCYNGSRFTGTNCQSGNSATNCKTGSSAA